MKEPSIWEAMAISPVCIILGATSAWCAHFLISSWHLNPAVAVAGVIGANQYWFDWKAYRRAKED